MKRQEKHRLVGVIMLMDEQAVQTPALSIVVSAVVKNAVGGIDSALFALTRGRCRQMPGEKG